MRRDTVKRILMLSVLLPALIFAGKVWFDFSTPLSAYIQGTIKGEDWFGASVGMAFWKIPQFEVTYMRIGSDHYILLKPLMLEGDISSIYDQLKLKAILDAGIDGSYPSYDVNTYLTTGLEISYETVGQQGVFFDLCFEFGIGLEIFKGSERFSPYYIRIFGPLVAKPSMIVGGKF